MEPHKTVTMCDPLDGAPVQIDAGIAMLIAEANKPAGRGRKLMCVEFEVEALDPLLNDLARDPDLKKAIDGATSVHVPDAADRDLFLDIETEIIGDEVLASASLRFVPELLPRVMQCLAVYAAQHPQTIEFRMSTNEYRPVPGPTPWHEVDPQERQAMNRVCIEKDEKGDIVGIYSDEPIRFFEANERDILNCCGAYEFTPGKTLRVGPEHVDAALGGDPIKYYYDDMCIE